ncbi:MAG: glutathione peroxidase [Gammaproteobacteria bacterium]|nr:glutathione peroxidase [Gammaproteobacteria bacterium]
MAKVYLLLFFFIGFAHTSCPKLLDNNVKILNEPEFQNLCEYTGKTILVVNTASKCGFTYQYEQLEELYRKYASKNFIVLGFPSRNFLYQEYDDESEVAEFCKSTFDVTFPLFSISNVTAANTNPFFEKLFRATSERPRWNFHKYLILADGSVKSYSHKIDPNDQSIVSEIEASIDS